MKSPCIYSTCDRSNNSGPNLLIEMKNISQTKAGKFRNTCALHSKNSITNYKQENLFSITCSNFTKEKENFRNSKNPYFENIRKHSKTFDYK